MDYQTSKASLRKIVFLAVALFGSLCFFSESAFAITITDSRSVSVSALVPDPNATSTGNATATPPSSGSTGGGWMYTTPFVSALKTNTIVVSGVFVPGIEVSILSGGNILTSAQVPESGAFSLTVPNLKTGVYSLLLTASDPLYKNKQYQSSLSYTVYVSDYAETYISDVVFPPIFSPVKTAFKVGSPVSLSGKAYPNSDVGLYVGTKLISSTKTSPAGLFSYNIKNMDKAGNYSVTFKYGEPFSSVPASKAQMITLYSQTAKNIEKMSACGTSSDFSQDCRVNIVDFSILAYWYKRSNFPKKYDLNSDGKIDIKDFSIMAYHWTG